MQLNEPIPADSEGLHNFGDSDNPNRRADIVFVHGISGGSHSTWQCGKGGENGHFFWLDALAADLPDCGIWSLGYAAGITQWFGVAGMPIQDRARNLVLKMLNRELGLRPLIFVTHSMGGLEVKEIIVRSQTCGSLEWKQLVASICGVVFCGTPHRGAHLATAAKVLANYFRSQEHLQQMSMGAPLLDTLHDEFITWQRATAVKVETYVERVGLFRTRWWLRPLPLGLVVPPESGNPGIAGCNCYPILADHITLVKPNGPSHDVYGGVLRFVTSALMPKPKEVMITVKLPDDFKTFSEQKKQEFRLFLAREANVSPDEILIGDPRAGSTKLDLQISEEAAQRILAKFATGQGALRERGIIKLDAKMSQSPEAKVVSLRRLGTATWAFVGRELELSQLDQIAEIGQARIVTIVAPGGIGKTTLVAQWLSRLAAQGWPGFEMVFDWSFYSQGTREQPSPSSDLFLTEALTFFGDQAMAGSPASVFDKGQRLAHLVGARRALVVLDGLEPLQYAPGPPLDGKLKDEGLVALLKGLALNSQGLCIITTRYSIPDLRGYWQTTAVEVQLPNLSQEAGVALLHSLGVNGSHAEYEKLVGDVHGHALSLKLIGSYLHYAHGGDIRRRDLVKLEVADAEEQGGHTFRVLEAYAHSLESEGENGRQALALLSLLGLFDRPAAADCLAALLQPPSIPRLTESLVGLTDAQRNVVLSRLEAANLLSVHQDSAGTPLSLDAHPLVREYFARGVRQQHPEAWRAAHRRLYEHLSATTADKPDATLEDLQPLYQAVAHGCYAGLQQEACDEVYFARIGRGREFYSTKKLGAFGSDLGAVACFFETPWSRVSPALTQADQAWLLNEAATRLRGLGRLTEALEPMRAGLEGAARLEDWKNAAIYTSNLSELELTLGEVELTLGEVAGAVGDAEQSVTYADRSGDAFLRMGNRTTLADALHQAGRRDEAEARFREAEQMQAEMHPDYPLLYSVQGFRYCDLLLSKAGRKAGRPEGELKKEEGLALCRAVAERAAQTLKWVTEAKLGLLDIALDHLTLGRAALYAAILESRSGRRESEQTSSPPPTSEASQHGFTSAATELDQAVSGLRRAGQQHLIPHGLLTRAWLRGLTGARTGPESARSDLDEAWEIAERGPMPLFLADIHLYRARLFFREAKYPWQSPQHDLAEARRLIFKHGYLRRKEELEDAEGLILGTPELDDR